MSDQLELVLFPLIPNEIILLDFKQKNDFAVGALILDPSQSFCASVF